MKIMISTPEYSNNYVNVLNAFGIEYSGGYVPEPDDSCDALLLCGGSDISPSIYGRDNEGSKGIDLQRDEAEIKLLELYKDKPILAICRGIQIVNAFFGGTLIQDIAQKDSHSAKGSDSLHGVTSKEGSLLYSLYGKSFTVNSNHHQAVEKVAEGFCVTAVSDDGVIEAIEHMSKNIVCVQWHPERLSLGFRTPHAVDGMPLFKAFFDRIKDTRS